METTKQRKITPEENIRTRILKTAKAPSKYHQWGFKTLSEGNLKKKKLKNEISALRENLKHTENILNVKVGKIERDIEGLGGSTANIEILNRA